MVPVPITLTDLLCALPRVADLRRVGGMRYNFDTELPTLLDIEAVDGPLPLPAPSPAPRR